MPPRRTAQRLRDMLTGAEKIARYIEGLSFEELQADEKTIDAVLRNLVVHQYFGVSLRIVWTTLKEDLPLLSRQLDDLLESELGDASD